jgi:hypothetical protein
MYINSNNTNNYIWTVKHVRMEIAVLFYAQNSFCTLTVMDIIMSSFSSQQLTKFTYQQCTQSTKRQHNIFSFTYN